jgi:CRISPR-associated protein Csb2
MLVRIEVLYPHQTVVGEQFPPSPSTVFQAIVAANGHRLDEISDVLQLMESGKCIRITQHSETTPISLRTAVPRMPKASEANNFKFDDPANKLLEPQKVFPLDGNGVHLSYYFELVSVAPGRLTDALKLHVLGRGESACMSRVSVLDRLPDADAECGIEWEPSAFGRRQLHVPYPGFLRNLRLYHDARKLNSKVPRRSATFTVKNSVTPYSAICYRLVDENGDTFKYPQENMSDVAAMMRHAMIVMTQGKLDGAYVSGHAKAHPFYLPVPSIGAEHADGDIRRIIVAEPAGLGLLSSNLAAITSLPLKDDSGKLVCYAVREPEDDSVFSRYLGASKTFHTVTPMILDRTGGKQRIGKRIGALITKAGFPKPIRITFNKTCWAGKLPVPVSRAQVYVDVEFPVAVSGPLAAGVAAGYGIGLFARG